MICISKFPGEDGHMRIYIMGRAVTGIGEVILSQSLAPLYFCIWYFCIWYLCIFCIVSWVDLSLHLKTNYFCIVFLAYLLPLQICHFFYLWILSSNFIFNILYRIFVLHCIFVLHFCIFSFLYFGIVFRACLYAFFTFDFFRWLCTNHPQGRRGRRRRRRMARSRLMFRIRQLSFSFSWRGFLKTFVSSLGCLVWQSLSESEWRVSDGLKRPGRPKGQSV